MVKKKTKVIIPGGLQGLVHTAQSGQESSVKTEFNNGNVKQEVESSQGTEGSAAMVPGDVASSFTRTAVRNEHGEIVKDRTAPAAKKLPKAEGKQLAREYTIARDSGEDSWQLFLDLAKDYKQRDSKLATVYIDSDLKSVLDRLKSASSIKMPSTALLSAIVARFVFDHEQDIKNAIFGESLL